MKRELNFSYLEIIGLAFLLGITAKVITPQLSHASPDDKVAVLINGLEDVRSNLELYIVQHEGNLPPSESFEDFEKAMTQRIGQHGPYLSDIPINPFNGLNTIRFDGDEAGNGEAGWRLDTEKGLFQADNDPDYAAL